ncbi:hypothetical protein LguiA_019317 [Lonicera macranthoides]
MDRRLIEAVWTGNIEYLFKRLEEDRCMLHSVALAGGEIPLHIACMDGHLDFVREVMKLKRDFAQELNQDGFTPLHIATAHGHIEIVKELLKMDLDTTSNDTSNEESRTNHPRSPAEQLLEYFKYNNVKDSPSKIRTTLLVIVILIATATYQAVLNPPGGAWQDDSDPSSGGNSGTNTTTLRKKEHTAGQAIMGTHDSTHQVPIRLSRGISSQIMVEE